MNKIIFIALTICIYEVYSYDYVNKYDENNGDKKDSESEDYWGDPENLEKPSYNLNEAPELFKKFITDYQRQYKDESEYNLRYTYFVQNLKDIIELNAKNKHSSSDINMFADYSPSELASLG
uniref:Cathepsin propeptide inhibitor domain-containing protein n=1 Tax=Bombyx mori TaxID=7091 RepID=A0A8R2ALI1_BOMMO|nr:uncharacterized protein LOC101738364 [Bombyx mori]